MVSSTQKVIEAQKEQAKIQQTMAVEIAKTSNEWRSQAASLDENVGRLKENQNQLKAVRAAIKSLEKEIAIYDQYKSKSEANIAVTDKLKDRIIGLTKEEILLKTSISELGIITRQQAKEMQAADDSMTKAGVTLGLMRKLYRDLSSEEKNSKFGQNLQAQIQMLDQSLKAADASIGNFQRNVGDYAGGFQKAGKEFTSAFSEFKGGNIQGGIEGTKKALAGLVATSKAFIASPIGLAVAALAGIAMAGKAIWDYNQGLRETLILTEQITGQAGEAADSIRQQAQAVTDTFGGDFRKNLDAAHKLVRAFGISYEEAFDQIARGLATGGLANDKFFSSLDRYPQQFAKAGYSAEQFLAIVNEGSAQGLFADKIAEGIARADASLKEQTDKLKNTLADAFGSAWSDDFLTRIKTGQTTTRDALTEMAAKAQEVGLNQTQLANITADVFKRAGRDVGGAAKYFDVLNASIENLDAPLNQTSQYFMDLKEANEELQEAMDGALKSDSVINFSQQWDIAWVKFKTGFFEVLGVTREVAEWFDRVSGRSESLSAVWASLTRIGDKIQQAMQHLTISFERMGEQLGITSEDGEGFLSIVSKMLDPVKWFEIALNGLVKVVEIAADGFIVATTYGEALNRSLTQLSKLNFKNLKGVGANAEDIKKENAEVAQRNKLEKERAETDRKRKKDAEELAASEMAASEAEKQAERDRAAAAEKARKENEKRQKAYAAEQKRLEAERKRRLEDQLREEIALSAALLDHFKITNAEKSKIDKTFSEQSIEAQKDYLDTLFGLEKKHAEKMAGFSFEDAFAIDIGARTSDQQKLVNFVIDLEQKKADAIKKINDDLATYLEKRATENFETEKKRIALDKAHALLMVGNTKYSAKERLKIEHDFSDQLNELILENFERTTGIDREQVEQKFENNEILTNAEIEFLDKIFEIRQADKERNDEVFQMNREEELLRLETALEDLGEFMGAEKEMRDAFEAYKRMQKAQDIGDTEAAEQAKLEIIANVAGAAASILGEYTAFGKAAAMVSAGVNTALAMINALTVQPPWLGIAMSAAIGLLGGVQMAKIAAQQPPKAPKFSAAFASGVINSDFEGRALVDEEGPELHYDRYGRLKSSGKGRPNIRDVKKGDTILPAPLSAKIREIANYNPVPDILSKFSFSGSGSDSTKFDKLERKMDDVKRAVSAKPGYVFDGKQIIEISGGNGSSHQRSIPVFGNERPNQNTLR